MPTYGELITLTGTVAPQAHPWHHQLLILEVCHTHNYISYLTALFLQFLTIFLMCACTSYVVCMIRSKPRLTGYQYASKHSMKTRCYYDYIPQNPATHSIETNCLTSEKVKDSSEKLSAIRII